MGERRRRHHRHVRLAASERFALRRSSAKILWAALAWLVADREWGLRKDGGSFAALSVQAKGNPAEQ
jgi:hypothetical protein